MKQKIRVGDTVFIRDSKSVPEVIRSHVAEVRAIFMNDDLTVRVSGHQHSYRVQRRDVRKSRD